MTDAFDDDLFQSLMQDVAPIKQDTHAPQTARANAQRLADRQAEAQTIGQQASMPFSFEDVPLCDPDDFLSYKKDGVQDGVFRKLRLGKYEIQARLDLHKKRLPQAAEAIWAFLQQCQTLDARSVLIVHGKGKHLNPPALLKSHIAHWLPELEDVLCFHSAQPQHGGTGALYVLLRKNAQKKMENRERHLNHRA